jgi:hypothetical protein
VARTIALLIAATALMQASQPPPSPGAVRTLDRGAQSNIDSARQAVAHTAAEFAAIWKAHNYDKPAPAVDFSREMVVAVFMGSRPTGGFSVEIVSATERDGQLVVTYRERLPQPDAITAQVLTSPYHIAAIPKSEKPVRFEKGKS